MFPGITQAPCEVDGKSSAVSAVVYWRENDLPKALEENQAGMDLGNRCGGLIWSQITLSKLLEFTQQPRRCCHYPCADRRPDAKDLA